MTDIMKRRSTPDKDGHSQANYSGLAVSDLALVLATLALLGFLLWLLECRYGGM